MAISGSAMTAIPDQAYSRDHFLHTAVSARKNYDDVLLGA